MTMEKHNDLKMYLLIKGGIFSIEMLDFGDVKYPHVCQLMSWSGFPEAGKVEKVPVAF